MTATHTRSHYTEEADEASKPLMPPHIFVHTRTHTRTEWVCVQYEWRDLDVFELERKAKASIYYLCVRSRQRACWEMVMNWNCLPLKNIICLQDAASVDETKDRDCSRPSPNTADSTKKVQKVPALLFEPTNDKKTRFYAWIILLVFEKRILRGFIINTQQTGTELKNWNICLFFLQPVWWVRVQTVLWSSPKRMTLIGRRETPETGQPVILGFLQVGSIWQVSFVSHSDFKDLVLSPLRLDLQVLQIPLIVMVI